MASFKEQGKISFEEAVKEHEKIMKEERSKGEEGRRRKTKVVLLVLIVRFKKYLYRFPKSTKNQKGQVLNSHATSTWLGTYVFQGGNSSSQEQ